MPDRQQSWDTSHRLSGVVLPPLDDEPYSEAERREDELARQEMARGERITLAEMKREFGL